MEKRKVSKQTNKKNPQRFKIFLRDSIAIIYSSKRTGFQGKKERARQSCRHQACLLPSPKSLVKKNKNRNRLSSGILTLCQKKMKQHVGYLRKRKCEPRCIIQPYISSCKKGTTIINLPKQTSKQLQQPSRKQRILFLY